MSDVFTQLKLFPLKQPIKNLVGNGEVLVQGTVLVKFTVLRGAKGIFASLPSQAGKKVDENGKIPYYPQVKIPNDDLYQEFQKMVRDEFNRLSTSQDQAGEGNQDFTDNVPF